MTGTVTATDGVIRADASYVKAAFLARVGMKDPAFRTARRAGLKVIYTGGRCYVRGNDWFAYLDRLASQQTPEAAD